MNCGGNDTEPEAKRSIRVFISSTFRDMVEDRNALMTHTWPELRRFCRRRQVELVEVDLRWGLTEEQSTRRETLAYCLGEIKACRPFFIGLLGERYGWVPGDDAFTDDLSEEQSWLAKHRGKSVTELEILHGVLINPNMAGRAYFYFRDPAYAIPSPDSVGKRVASGDTESEESKAKQRKLKEMIRATCAQNHIPLYENYSDPATLASLVLENLKAAIEAQFPLIRVPDPLSREARNHEAFAESRRRTYIGRPDYFAALDAHAVGAGAPLVLVGDSGSGKSALLANWVEHWRTLHPQDYIFQHYIGGTADSADHGLLMARLAAEIKRWTGGREELPKSHDDLLKDFPVWLARARAQAERKGVRFIILLDALNQLEESGHARLLGWLPTRLFSGPLRLVVSTLPGDMPKALKDPERPPLFIQPLTRDERCQMVAAYLARFGKTLGKPWVELIAAAPAAANPLYLKILLDELRVTGTHDKLGEKLQTYLSEHDVSSLLCNILARYQRDYERDRPGLVGDTLGLVYAARRGLSESELLHLLRPADRPQLPPAVWAPLRAALEDSFVNRGGIFNFAHDYFRTAAERMFVADEARCASLRLRLADHFEAQPITDRTCDELPWLLKKAKAHRRLRSCLLNIDRFLLIIARDEEELRRYWISELREQQAMGREYLNRFALWSRDGGLQKSAVAAAANELGTFLLTAALHADAEPLIRRALEINTSLFGESHADVASNLSNLAELLKATNRFAEAEPLLRRAIEINTRLFGKEHPNVAQTLSNLAMLLRAANRLAEAEPLMRSALDSSERTWGRDHPNVAIALNNLAMLLSAANRPAEAEPLMRRALDISERALGDDHSAVSIRLSNLAALLQATSRLDEAEPLMRRALHVSERAYGHDHPRVAICLNNLARLLQDTNRLAEAEPLLRRALDISEFAFGKCHPHVAIALANLALLLQARQRLCWAEPLFRRALEIDERSVGSNHPDVARDLSNLAQWLQAANRLDEAEPLIRRALAIDERCLGCDHPSVARDLNNYAMLLQATNRLAEAEPLMRRMVDILLKFTRETGHKHPDLQALIVNYAGLLKAKGLSLDEIRPLLRKLAPEFFQS